MNTTTSMIQTGDIHVGPSVYRFDGIRAYRCVNGPDVLHQPWEVRTHPDGYEHFAFIARMEWYFNRFQA